MKPKFRRFAKTALPALIVVPFLGIAQAGIFDTDDAGNASPTVLNNGANTIRADGGELPLNPNPLVNILNGVTLTGDTVVPETEVLEITAANYTVTNAGSLSGTNHHGINSTAAFTLTNTGTIAGGGAGRRGILTVGGLTNITNGSVNLTSASISGTNDGIHFTTDGGIVTNYGTISGTTGSYSDGIKGQNGLKVTNNNAISGAQQGVDAGDSLILDNNHGASITGGTRAGVEADDIARIDNAGSISGNEGIDVGNNAIINNKYTDLFGPTDAGGSIIGLGGNGVTATTDLTLTSELLGLIQGSTNGIVAGDGGAITTNVNNSGTITGLAGDGVQAQDSFVVVNNSGGVITGSMDGIEVEDGADIVNSGAITGTGDDGINAGFGSTITNNITGTITGRGDGIDFDGTGAANTINNYGTITGGGGQAIDGSDSVETVNLYLGSRVIGDVEGDGGLDILNFIGGLTTVSSASGSSSNSILGDVEEFDVINKSGTGVAFIGVPGDAGYSVEANTININSGGLYINGDVSSYTVLQTTINAGGSALGGTGLWDADISITAGGVSAGAIPINLSSNPNNAIGTLSIDGNVTHSAGTFIRHDINPSTGSDDLILHSGGTYALGANTDIRVSVTDNNTVLRDGSYTVINSNAVITGGFPDMAVQFNANVNANDTGFVGTRTGNTGVADTTAVINQFMYSDFTNSDTDLVFVVEHDYSQFGSTDNEVAAGEMLNDLVNTATGELSDLLAAMDYSDESYTEAVLAALDPGAYMAAVAGLANNNYHLHRTVENHNAAVRAGSIAPVMPPAADPSAKGATVAAPVASGCAGGSNVWGSFSYDWQDLQTSSSSFDQDGEVYAFTAGIDFTVAENFRLGFVAEGSQSDWDGELSLGSEVESYRFAGYANWGAATGWFMDALLGYNTHSVDQSIGNFFGDESASYDADGWQGLVNAGYAMTTTAGTFSPYLGLEWQQLSADSVDTDFGSLPGSIGDYDIDSFRALAGVRWEAQLAENIMGYASATYAFQFEDDAPDATVEFGGGSYRADGLEQGDSVLVSAGIRWGVATCTTLDVGYRGEFAMDDGVDSNGANIGLNYSF